MKVRVYQPVDGPVRILRLNARRRLDADTDETFLEREAAHAEAADPTLAGLPFVDLDEAEIPTERQRTVGAERFNVRAAWRIVNGRVTIDATRLVRIPQGGR